MINEKFTARFEELQRELDEMPVAKGDYSYYVESDVWLKWATSAQSLIGAACGTQSPYYKNFSMARDRCDGRHESVKAMGGIFRSAKEAFDGDYLFDVERDMSAEIFGDFVVLAKRALAEDYKDVAAVLASAALEDVLKRYA